MKVETRFSIGDVVCFYKRGIRRGIIINLDADFSMPFSTKKEGNYTQEFNTSIGRFFFMGENSADKYITYTIMEPDGNINYDVEERDLYRNPELLSAAIERSLNIYTSDSLEGD